MNLKQRKLRGEEIYARVGEMCCCSQIEWEVL